MEYVSELSEVLEDRYLIWQHTFILFHSAKLLIVNGGIAGNVRNTYDHVFYVR